MNLFVTLKNKIKSFKTPNPNITKIAEVDGVRYGYLTDLKIIDDQLQLDLIAYADYCLAQGVLVSGNAITVSELYASHCNNGGSEEMSDPLLELSRRFSSFNTHKPAELNDYFKRYDIPLALETRIKQNLPKKIRKSNFELLMLITNFGTPLHRDVSDKVIILCPLVTNDEITSFWEVKEEYKDDHLFSFSAFADPDKVERKLDLVFKPKESWILNVDKIHAVEPTNISPTKNRIVITLRWFDNITMSDLVNWFEVK
jgi:hypothetical protein